MPLAADGEATLAAVVRKLSYEDVGIAPTSNPHDVRIEFVSMFPFGKFDG